MYSKFRITQTHGFLHSKECLKSYPGLEKHIAALKNFKSLSPQVMEDLPEFSPSNSMSIDEQEFAFLVHTTLNSSYYWHEKSNQSKIPKNLARPTIFLSKLLRRPPMISLASIQFHNWCYLSNSQNFHPDHLDIFFSFSGTRDESHFFNIANYIEFLGAPALNHILNLTSAHDPKTLSNSLEHISESIENMSKALKLMFEKIDPHLFYFGFRKNLKSFGQVDFESTQERFENLMGASAVQSPLIKVFDIFIGLEHKSQYLKESEKYLIQEHRELLAELRRWNWEKIREMIKVLGVQKEYNDVILGLEAFRRIHMELCQQFISKPSGSGCIVGTGGSPLIEFLGKIQRKTQGLVLK